MRQALVAVGFLLLAGASVRAQPEPIPVSDQDMATGRVPQQGYPLGPVGPASEDYSRPLTENPEPLSDPAWCAPIPTHFGWRIGIEFNPTTSKISDGANFGFDTEDSVLAGRFIIDYEKPNGIGYRLQWWDFDEVVRFPFPWGDIRTEATTIYFDVSERIVEGAADLKFGAGPAFAQLRLGPSRNEFDGIGASVFGEGFYPLLHYPRTDFGVTAHARFALLAATSDDVIHDSLATIDDFGWGLELRYRYGARMDKYLFVDALREIQYWTGTSHPFAADEVFQGMSFKLGFGW